jgi:hypothetical protein
MQDDVGKSANFLQDLPGMIRSTRKGLLQQMGKVWRCAHLSSKIQVGEHQKVKPASVVFRS